MNDCAFFFSAPLNSVVCPPLQDSSPASIDLFGTCFSEKARPPTLKYQHIQRCVSSEAMLTTGPKPSHRSYESLNGNNTVLNTNTGVSNIDDHGRDAVCSSKHSFDNSDWDQKDSFRLNTSQAGVQKETAIDQEAVLTNRSWEDLFPNNWQQNAVHVDTDKVDFGSCSRLVAGEYKTVTVKNSFHRKVTTFVSIPLWEDPSGVESPKQILEVRLFCSGHNAMGSLGTCCRAQEHTLHFRLRSILGAFQVFPPYCDIKAGGEASFRIAFRPNKDACYFHAILDIFSYVKTMRNFRLVHNDELIPPWNCTVQVGRLC